MTVDPSEILLTDRIAVVTGAGQGLGRAIATSMARFGAHVATCDRNEVTLDELAAELGDGHLCRVLDVRDADAVDRFVAEVVDRWGRVDVLVNNAGGTFFAPLLDVSGKGEAMLVAENFTQVTRLVRRCVPHMPEGGSIVNLTSIEAHQAAPGFAVYAAMKAAVAQLTKTLALELATLGIRVNNIAPDAMPTGGECAVRDQMLDADSGYDPATLPPLGWFGTGDEAAAVAVFLASPMSRFVTGTTLHVDGGNWAAGGWRRVTDR